MKKCCDRDAQQQPIGLKIFKTILWSIVIAVVLFACYEQFLKT